MIIAFEIIVHSQSAGIKSNHLYFYTQIEAAGIEKYSALNGDMAKQLEYVYSFLEDDEELRNIPMNVIPPEENVPR